MAASTLVLVLGPFIAIVFLAGLFFFATERLRPAADDRPKGSVAQATEGLPRRPLWWNPLVWLSAGAVLTLLGVLIAPRVFGVAILFLPIIWVGGLRRHRRRP